MFYAYNSNGQWESLFKLSPVELKKLRNESFYCPECKNILQIRAGPKVTPHFAHLPKSECSRRESIEHETGKWDLYQWFLKQGYCTELERYVPEIKQRPDIFISLPDKNIAIEYQCAKIPLKEIEKRTTAYLSRDIFPLWILGSNHFKQKNSFTLCTSAFIQSFLYHFNNSFFLYFFNAKTKHICINSHIQSSTARTMIAHPQTFSLSRLSFPQLFKSSTTSLSDFHLQFWKKQLYIHRTKYKMHVSSDEHQFRQFLYLRGYHYSLIPSIAYIPLAGQVSSSTKSFIWQTRLIIEHFLPVEVGSLFKFPKIACRKTINGYTPDLTFEYLIVLEKLGYVKQSSGDKWLKIKEVEFPRDVENALAEDRMLIHALKKFNGI